MSDLPGDPDYLNLDPEDPEPTDPGYIDDDQEPIDPEPTDPDPEDPEPTDPEPGQQARQTQRKRPGEVARWRDRYEALEREVAGIKAAQTHPRPQAPDPEAAARAHQAKMERWAMLSPAEVVMEAQRESEQRISQILFQQQHTTAQTLDRQAYETKAQTSRLHREYAPRVEALLKAEHDLGNLGANRASILKYLVGEDALNRAETAAPAQRRAASRRVAGQQTRPTGARGDGAVSRRESGNSIEAARARIAGKPIW